MPATDAGMAHSFVSFLGKTDAGLRGNMAASLGAVEMQRIAQSCRCARHSVLPPGMGLCCPHVCPSKASAMSAALLKCDAKHLLSLRPTQEFESAAYLADLVERLPLFSSLCDVGPLFIDITGGPVLLQRHATSHAGEDIEAASTQSIESGWQFATPQSLLPSLGASFAGCLTLAKLSLSLQCMDDEAAQALSDVFLPALGGCCKLRSLLLDLDTPLSCGAAVADGLATMLERLSAWHQLEQLDLGYLWWTEASDDTAQRFHEASHAFGCNFRHLVIRCPQDQELGALEVASDSLILGAATSLVEVVVQDAWGQDGTGLSSLFEALGLCGELRRVEFQGQLPDGLDKSSIQSSLHSARLNKSVAALTHPEVIVN
eukprot:TRINITY_DN50082_c0_g1_i1.p1 TRINITY_DN50082_c0_g1~~TRINITY_DN50082_c0_g1_i1.p1  ORF type:complete len:374 (-),score=66.96 TRINITY_DN50082_c0_g1_i1:166-1287(-)